MTKIKILIAIHKKCFYPDHSIFLPIHVGKKTSNDNLYIIGDDTGDNISDKNNLFCELTAIYWAWKNINYEYDYIGLFHYRRFLTYESKNIFKIIYNKINFLFCKIFYYNLNYHYKYNSIIHETNKKNILNHLKSFNKKLLLDIHKYKMFSLRETELNVTVEVFFSRFIDLRMYNLLNEIILNLYPDISIFYLKLLYNRKLFSSNIFIFSTEIYNEYCNFIFTVLFTLEKDLLKNDIKPNPRTFGYIGELLTSSFISYKNINDNSLKKLNQVFYFEY